MTFSTILQSTPESAFSLGKIVCVGRNYAAHAAELNNPVPEEPLLFIKPESAACDLDQAISLPLEECHYETELAVLIGSTLSKASKAEVIDAILGVGLALDLTLRQVQSRLKKQGHPWEIAKSFDGSCPLSSFIPLEKLGDLEGLNFTLRVNNELRQQGHSSEMLTPIVALIQFISGHFTLKPGDVVLTGTPQGVGVLNSGDHLAFQLSDQLTLSTRVI